MNIQTSQSHADLVITILEFAETKASGRLMVAIAGGPASGKSTLGSLLVDQINKISTHPRALYIPMDGFHKSAATLEAEGTTSLKGKPETFDVLKLCAFLQQIKRGEKGFYGPHYSRIIHDVVEASYLVADQDIAIVEGNYLFLDELGWDDIRNLFDYRIFVTTNEQTCNERLHARHLAGGKSADWIEEHIAQVDMPNYHLILPTQSFAHILVSGE